LNHSLILIFLLFLFCTDPQGIVFLSKKHFHLLSYNNFTSVTKAIEFSKIIDIKMFLINNLKESIKEYIDIWEVVSS